VQSLPPILPVGTSVVTRIDIAGADRVWPRGSAGRIVQEPVDPEHSYRVRFVDGDEVALRRAEFQVLASHQSEGLTGVVSPLLEHDLQKHVVYRCVIGSRAYGLENAASDTDRRGVYIAPARLHWSIYGVPEQLENDATQECYWEYEKYLRLALKANPNVLETLYSPIVEHTDPIVEPLLSNRHVFLTRMIYQTFNGYAMSQFRKIEQDVRARGELKWKHAMHLVRLLRVGIGALREHELRLNVGADRDELLAIKRGEWSWQQVDALRLQLHRDFETAFVESTLPERPDYQKANELLVEVRRRMSEKETG
jgi:uncharacterized protein